MHYVCKLFSVPDRSGRPSGEPVCTSPVSITTFSARSTLGTDDQIKAVVVPDNVTVQSGHARVKMACQLRSPSLASPQLDIVWFGPDKNYLGKLEFDQCFVCNKMFYDTIYNRFLMPFSKLGQIRYRVRSDLEA